MQQLSLIMFSCKHELASIVYNAFLSCHMYLNIIMLVVILLVRVEYAATVINHVLL